LFLGYVAPPFLIAPPQPPSHPASQTMNNDENEENLKKLFNTHENGKKVWGLIVSCSTTQWTIHHHPIIHYIIYLT
jgi:hypothetical protein